MIGVSLSMAVFLYFAIWLGLIVFLWARELLRVKNYQWQLSNSRLRSCDKCHYAFLARDDSHLTRCPRCNAICIRRKRQW